MLRFVEIYETADKKIEAAIVVIIKPHRTGCPAWSGHAGFFGHVGKSSVAVVAIQNAAAVLRHIKVGEAICVVISYGNAHAVASAGYSGFFSHVGKSSVPIIPVERVAQRACGSKNVAGPAIHEIDVHPAIVVVIKERATSAGRFGKIFLRRVGSDMSPSDTTQLGGNC